MPFAHVTEATGRVLMSSSGEDSGEGGATLFLGCVRRGVILRFIAGTQKLRINQPEIRLRVRLQGHGAEVVLVSAFVAN